MNQFLKYSVILSDAIMTLHCLLLLVGIKSAFAEYVTGHCVMGAAELFLASFLLKFCWLYRGFIAHNLLVYSCIIFEREVGFGWMLVPVRCTMLAIGTFLIILIFKDGRRSDCDWKPHRTDGASHQERRMRTH